MLFIPSRHQKYKDACKKVSLLCCILCISFLLPLRPLAALAGVPLVVDIRGLEKTLHTNVTRFLSIEKNKNKDELNARWIKRLHEQAPEEIRQALQPFGYYLPEIQAELSKENDTWLARYTIDAGEPVRFSKRDIQWTGEGISNPLFQQSIRQYIADAGDKLIHAEYEAAKGRFLNLALSEGYPRARIVNSEILVDLAHNSADMTLLMDTGPLYYFGEIRFKQHFLDPDLLQKYITLGRGEPYSHESLLAFQQNLIASNYAREVTLTPLFDQEQDKQLPLEVVMKPIVPHKFSFGLGYETDVGVRGSARWTDRLINRHGHHSDLYLKLSQKEGLLRGQYSVPVYKALTDSWVSTADYDYEVTPDTSSKALELETAFVRTNLGDTSFYKGFILASYEQFIVGNDPEVKTNLITPGTTFRFSDVADSMYPRHGYSFFSDLRGAYEPFFSDTSFTRIQLMGRYLFGLGENGRLDTRMEIGAAWVDNFDVYPVSLRFFTGGDNSVRGYDYESLGPVDKEGVVTGGKQMFSSSIEYDYRIAETWVLDVFVDGGNAYNGNLDRVYVGSGFGFRWLAPFGSLRVDLAWPASENPNLDDARIHIGFGATL